MIGQTLGRYRIVEKVGEGGMGVVYRAHDERLDRDVAVKVLTSGRLDGTARERLRTEALALSKLNHPHVATIHDFDTQDDTDFLAMEYVAGPTLGDRLNGGPLPEREVLRLGAELADGLTAAHGAGLVHRDLKPANIRLTPDGVLKILDFGLAQRDATPRPDDVTWTATDDGLVAGTLPYMAPEQLRGEPTDARTDIYSTGVVLFEMATGRRPFDHKTMTGLAADVQTKAPPSPLTDAPDLSPRLVDIILKCLEKEPDRRYQSATELRVDLRRLTAGEPEASTETVTPRRFALMPVVALVAVLAMVVVGLTSDRVRDPLVGDTEAAPVAVADTPSLAVLPFQNLSADPENAYFSGGMTAELLSRLAQLPGVRVTSAVMSFTGAAPEQTVEQMRSSLGVSHVLQGSVRKAGESVRISVMLVDAVTGASQWANDFDGQLDNIFALQEQTALQIAEALDLELNPDAEARLSRPEPEVPAAYDAYLRGYAIIEALHLGSIDMGALSTGRAHFDRALELDPDYASALAGLAEIEALTYSFIDPTQEHLDRAEQLVNRAIEIDPDLPQANVALAQVHRIQQDHDGALDAYYRAVDHDPNNAYIWCQLGFACLSQSPSDIEGAEEAARESIRSQPGYAVGHRLLAMVRLQQGRLDEAAAANETLLELLPTDTAALAELAVIRAQQGNEAAALVRADELRALGDQWQALLALGRVYAALGNVEEALAHLGRAVDSGVPRGMEGQLMRNPGLAPLRDDPRFLALIDRVRAGQ